VAQVRALRRFLDQHRNLDKVAVLLKLNGYAVSPRACRRAIEHLVLDQLDDLDPHGRRHYQHPEEAAAAAARTISKRRPRTTSESEQRKKEQAAAGGRDAHQALLAAAVRPLLGSAEIAALQPVVEYLGVSSVVTTLSAAAPEIGGAVAEEVAAGHVSFDWIRQDALPGLTADDYNTGVRLLRYLLAVVERLVGELNPKDAFVRDCMHALRDPDRRLPAPPPNRADEADVEAGALAFFAGRKQRRQTHPATE
jgi:hypothetical protein